jgi:Domain of unknown function (DUF397)
MEMSQVNAELLPAEWRKARRSMGNGNCVEISTSKAGVTVRDSKDVAGPVIAYSPGSWLRFASETRLGRFDPTGK